MSSLSPQALARVAYPVLLKLATQGQESLQHKGGKLVPVHKHKGPHDCCSSYRSILISSHFGKTIHRALRQAQLQCYERFLQAQQIGGRPGACPSLWVAEAFYRVFRPLALDGPIDDAAIAKIAQRMNLPDSALHEFYMVLQDPAAIDQAGLPRHLQCTLRALHTDTWFQFGQQADATRTEVGTRPGDSFADIVFGYLFSRLLHQLQAHLHEADCLDLFPATHGSGLFVPTSEDDPHRPFMGPTWMDDLCICVSAETAKGLETKTQVACSILLESCARHLVTPNLSKGKTETIMAFRGPGSRALRQRYYGPQHGNTLQVVHEHGTAAIAVVGQYRHLGGILRHSGSNHMEITRRFALAHTAFTSHRKALLQNGMLPEKRRRELFVTLVESQLTFGLESWYAPEKVILAKGEAALCRLYRRLCKIPHDAHWQRQALYAQCTRRSPFLSGYPAPCPTAVFSHTLQGRRCWWVGHLILGCSLDLSDQGGPPVDVATHPEYVHFG